MIRKVLGLATAAALAVVVAPQAHATCNDNCTLKDTSTYVTAYEVLPTSGHTIPVSIKFSFPDNTTLHGGSKTSVSLTVATFADPANTVLVADDNGTMVVVKYSGAAANKIDFEYSEGYVFLYDTANETIGDPYNATQIDAAQFVPLYITELSGTNVPPEDEAKVNVNIPGNVTPGTVAKLSIINIDPKSKNSDHIGCAVKPLIIVQNQFIAQSPGVDEEGLAVVFKNDKAGIFEVIDDEISEEPSMEALYNPRGGTTTTTGSSCPSTDACCEDICAVTVSEEGGCTLPGFCGSTKDIKYLAIFQHPDFNTYDVALNATTLATSKVTLTLKSDSGMTGVSKVEFLRGLDNETLCSGEPNNGTFSCTVDGNELFVPENKDSNANGAIYVKFKVYVDGSTQLKPETFYATAELFGGEIVRTATLDWGKVMTWGQTEGYAPVSFKIPYVRVDEAMTTAIRLENTSNKDLPVALYVSDPEGGWKFLEGINLAKGEERIITGAEILEIAANNGIDLTATKNGRFSVLGITNTTNDTDLKSNLSVYVSQQIIGTNNVRFVPVDVICGVPEDLHF